MPARVYNRKCEVNFRPHARCHCCIQISKKAVCLYEKYELRPSRIDLAIGRSVQQGLSMMFSVETFEVVSDPAVFRTLQKNIRSSLVIEPWFVRLQLVEDRVAARSK